MQTESHTSSPGFDALDRRLLSALALDGRASFSRVAAVLGVSDQTVARRYRRLCADGGLRVVVMRDAHRLGEDQWMLRVRCAPDSAPAIAEALAKRPDTSWVGLASGGTEVLCMTRPRSSGDHDDLLLGKLPRTPSVMEIRAHQLLHRFYGGAQSWVSKLGALTAAETEALRPRHEAAPGHVRITPDDEPLLAALERDGRAGYPELQRATGLTESAARRRLAALLASGAVFVDSECDPGIFGHPVSALLWITAAPSALHSVGEALAGHPGIAHASAATGPCNIIASVLARNTADLYAYLSGPLGRLEGVRHVDTTVFLRRIKQLTYRERGR
ncbi:Lrp/AsnC family transcriptional regulator [Streptomyces griseorubiginosus]|uniref:Lrp/AsnC family transcriptional regulator n=1 Tax=Streptomyces griseorubiginosus TaxID=67304 RepID=UPI00076C1242|nr:Lrp/AsnC family transcriptional regulator [Streptomyces griseorubiginosus]KUM79656.1 AsnC family transcriptional regulator [Streptomyces griseorubiginosus]